ncbi:MAG: hypothetical protein RLZZ436_2799 [Planctomycetota bacterium]|jgi:DNA-directed RNA polymerase specialized sigma24 family protein
MNRTLQPAVKGNQVFRLDEAVEALLDGALRRYSNQLQNPQSAAEQEIREQCRARIHRAISIRAESRSCTPEVAFHSFTPAEPKPGEEPRCNALEDLVHVQLLIREHQPAVDMFIQKYWKLALGAALRYCRSSELSAHQTTAISEVLTQALLLPHKRREAEPGKRRSANTHLVGLDLEKFEGRTPLFNWLCTTIPRLILRLRVASDREQLSEPPDYHNVARAAAPGVDPELFKPCLKNVETQLHGAVTSAQLTHHELHMLLLLTVLTEAQIARLLKRNPGTINRHVTSARTKLKTEIDSLTRNNAMFAECLDVLMHSSNTQTFAETLVCVLLTWPARSENLVLAGSDLQALRTTLQNLPEEAAQCLSFEQILEHLTTILRNEPPENDSIHSPG